MSELSTTSIQEALIDAQLRWHHVGKHDVRSLSKRFDLTTIRRLTDANARDFARELSKRIPKAIRERRLLLDTLGIDRKNSEYHENGRLMVFYHYHSMNDGLAGNVTGRLLDHHNCPPSGFWSGLVDGMGSYSSDDYDQALISWILTELVEIMTNGIEVIAERCIEWADSHELRDTQLGQHLLTTMQPDQRRER